ncbi:MAG: COX15/CtaA family protein [Candidatus Kapabacteria bacterium]|nr:COX15/CtaA family protein [Candidatus Kapabacteria bacterium]
MTEKSTSNDAIRFRRFGIVTIAAIYILIAVGGIVRATGSGMGCPDFPTCFGQWIPPTDISQLPADYKTQFAVQGKEIADFNAVHTWTEYVNRLVGILIGMLIFVTFLLSAKFWNCDRRITFLSVAAFILVAVQGALGAIVVKTNLQPVIITFHAALALVIVMLIVIAVIRSYKFEWKSADAVALPVQVGLPMIVSLTLLFLQIVLGSQVRQAVDEIHKLLAGQSRETWLESIGILFYVHRSFSLVVLGVHLWMLYRLRQFAFQHPALRSFLFRWGGIMVGCISIEIISGAVMGYFAIPPAMQPIHLFLGSVMFGVDFLLYMRVRTFANHT